MTHPPTDDPSFPFFSRQQSDLFPRKQTYRTNQA